MVDVMVVLAKKSEKKLETSEGEQEEQDSDKESGRSGVAGAE